MPLATATRVGPYEIVSTLGGGAMGEVYVARDSRLNRNVALKIIASESSNDEVRKRRFVQEARSASALNHPNIVIIHDFGTLDGISYIVSELVEGESLKKIIGRGPVPMAKLLDIAVQIAEGLAAAHGAGIIHRDLKPDNIMVGSNGRVKILDFGLAKPVLPEPFREDELEESTYDGLATEPGLILGTVGYMSPEQARGAPVSFQSDQFSLGVILHEMASGQQAFKRETPMQTLLAIANVDRVPFTPGPVAFRLLVERCLSKQPSGRFANTVEIAERLRKVQAELPQKVKDGANVPAARAARLPIGRNAARAVIGALLIFGLGVLAARLLSRTAAPDLSKYKYTPIAEGATLPAFPAFSGDAKMIAYSAESGGTFQIFVQPVGSDTGTQLTKTSDDCLFPYWSSDNTHVFYISSSKLWSAALSGGSPILVQSNVARPTGSVQMPDKRHVVYSDHGHLWMANTSRAERIQLTAGPLSEETPAVSPDGSEIAFQSLDADYEAWEISLASGGSVRRQNALAPAWSPVRPEYAFVTTRGSASEIRLRDRSSGWERLIARSPDPLSAVAFSPDGQRIAYTRSAFNTSTIWVRDIAAGAEVRLVDGAMPTWSPDGNWIAYLSKGSLLKIPVGSAVGPVVINKDAGLAPAWSPEGNWIAVLGFRGGIVLISSDGKKTETVGSDHWLCATWSKEGRRLYGLVKMSGNRLAFASVDTESKSQAIVSDLGAFPAALTYANAGGQPPVLGASLSPDGQSFLTSVYRANSKLWLLSGFPVI